MNFPGKKIKIPPKPAEIRFRKDPIPFCKFCFTEAELRTIRSLLKSPIVKDMTVDLGWADKTVKFYRAIICRKFGVTNVDELLVFWLRLDVTRSIHAVTTDHRKGRTNRSYTRKTLRQRAEEAKEYQKQYYQDNKDKIKKRSSEWRKDGANVAKYQAQKDRAAAQRRKKRSILAAEVSKMNGNRDDVPAMPHGGPMTPGYAVTPDMGLGTPGTANHDTVPAITPLPNGSPIDVTNDSDM